MSDKVFYLVAFVISMIVVMLVNHFVFGGNPSDKMLQSEEALVEGITGVDIELSPDK